MTKRIDIYAVGHESESTCANVWTTRKAAEDDYSSNTGSYLDKYTFIGPSWRGLGCACVQLGASIAGDSCDGLIIGAPQRRGPQLTET